MLLLAKSKCGHDKDEIYVVYAADEDEGFYALVNGRNRTVEYPKKKRMKHVQLIRHLDQGLVEKYEQAEAVTDDLIKQIIKDYSGGKKKIV
jgi:hypothetical protein